MSCGKSSREYILHSAAIGVLFTLRPPFSGEKPEFVKALKKFLLSSLVPMFTTMHMGVTDQQHCDQAISNFTVQSQTTPETVSKTSVSTSRPSVSTLKLIEARNLRNEQKKGAQNTRTRALDSRIKKQNVAFLHIARDIHCGAKENFIFGMAEAVNKSKPSKVSTAATWDGSLTIDDIVYLTKRTNDPIRKKSVYEILITEHSANISHLSAIDIIKMQDNYSMTQLFRVLRRKLPRFFDSERQTDKLKMSFNKEFEVLLEPMETKTGFCINPDRLFECLHFVCP